MGLTVLVSGRPVEVGEAVRLPISHTWRGRLYGFHGGEFFCADPDIEAVVSMLLAEYDGERDREAIDPVVF